MLLCRARDQNTTCNTPNRDGSQFCQQCGHPLQNALYVHNTGVKIGRYRILRLIDHGSFGAVYEAEVLTHPEVHIALKESLDPENIPEFATEFAVLYRLRHLNLPRYYEMFEYRGTGFLAMEFIYGQSLASIIKRQGGPLSEQMVFTYADQICEVLTYLHSHRPPVIHRDIKPQNVLLTSEGQVKLVDFGLVKQGMEMVQGTARAGTLLYAPPEQWLGGTNTRSDIYSFGATLYHLLTGRKPLAGIHRYRFPPDTLQPPHTINQRVTTALSDVVMRAMELDQARRFQSISDMHQALLDARRYAVSTRPLNVVGMEPARPKPSTSQLVSRPGVTRQLDAARLASPSPAAVAQVAVRPHEIRPLQRWIAGADMVNALAWSPDGRLLATAGGDGRIVLWQIAAGGAPPPRLRSDMVAQSSLLALAWSPDGRLLASGGRSSRVFTTRTSDGYGLAVWEGHASYITCLAWSPDGRLVASAGWEGVVRLWRASDGYLLAALTGQSQRVDSLIWSPDGRLLASGSAGLVQIWDVERQHVAHVLRGLPRSPSAITWSPDGPLVAFGGPGGMIQIQTLHGSASEIAPLSAEEISGMAWCADAQTLAVVYGRRMIGLWHRRTASGISFVQPSAVAITSLAWHPGGRILVGAGDDRSVQLWEIIYRA